MKKDLDSSRFGFFSYETSLATRKIAMPHSFPGLFGAEHGTGHVVAVGSGSEHWPIAGSLTARCSTFFAVVFHARLRLLLHRRVSYQPREISPFLRLHFCRTCCQEHDGDNRNREEKFDVHSLILTAFFLMLWLRFLSIPM